MATASSITIPALSRVHTSPADRCKNWIRALLCIYYVIRPALFSLLHNEKIDPSYKGLSKDKNKLYCEIKNLKSSKNNDFKILKKDQIDIALPPDGTFETDSSQFDVTMLKFFVMHGTTLPPPRGGWKHHFPPAPGDDRRTYACCLAVEERNKLSHPYTVELSDIEFDDLWDRLVIIVTDLGFYGDYKDLMCSLKTGLLEPYLKSVVDVLKQKVIDLSNDSQSKVDDKQFNLLENKVDQLDKIRSDQVNENIEACLFEICRVVEDVKNLKDNVKYLTSNIKQKANIDDVVELMDIVQLKADNRDVMLNAECINQLSKSIEHTADIDDVAHLENILELKADKGDVKKLAYKLEETIETMRNDKDLRFIRIDNNDKFEENVSNKAGEFLDLADQNGTIKVHCMGNEPSKSTTMINGLSIAGSINGENSSNGKPHKIESRSSSHQLAISSHNCNQILHHFETVDIKHKDHIQFCSGGRTVVQATQKEWQSLAMDYTNTYFTSTKSGVINEPIIFPPSHKIQEEISQFAVSLRNYLSNTPGGVGAVITDYKAEEHFSFVNDTQTMNDIGINRIGDYKNRILLLQPDHNAIFNIRYTDTTEVDEVYRQFEYGENDIKLLMSTTKNIIQNKTISFLNVLATKNILSHEIGCENCLVLDKDILSDDKKLNKSLSEFLFDSFKDIIQANADKVFEGTFKEIFSSIIGFMATRELPLPIPAIYGNTSKKVKSIRLTHQQLRVLLSEELKKIILGNFGTGKSLLALYHLQWIMYRAVRLTVIYYICWEEFSLCLHDVKNFLSSLVPKENVVCNVTNLGDLTKELKFSYIPSFSTLIKTLLEKCAGKELHVIIDECNCELLDKKESEALKELFKTCKDLKRSYVILLPHSLEKHRTYLNKNVVLTHDKYRYEETGMGIYKLNRCMRTTSKNFKAIRESQELLSTLNNTINHSSTDIATTDIANSLQYSDTNNEYDISHKSLHSPSSNENDKPKQNSIVKLAKKIFVKKSIVRSKSFNVLTPLDSHQKKRSNRRQTMQLSPGYKQTFSQSEILTDVHELGKSKPIDKNMVDLSQYPNNSAVDVDCLASKVTNTADGTVKTETALKFASNYDIVGHNIDGVNPIVVIFNAPADSYMERIMTLTMVLKGKLLHDKCVQFILSENEFHHFLFKSALELLEKPYIIRNATTNWHLKDSSGKLLNRLPDEDYTLITTSRSARGTEADSVIACFEPNEHHLRHLVIENISRSTSDLYLLCFDKFETDRHDGDEATAGHMIANLIEKNLVDILLVKWFENGNEYIDYNQDVSQILFYSSLKMVVCFFINQLSLRLAEYRIKLATTKYDSGKSVAIDLYNRILTRFDKAQKVEGIKCSKLGNSSCKLSWNESGCQYVIQRRVIQTEDHSQVWQDLAREYNKSEIIIDDLIGKTEYEFSVATISDVKDIEPTLLRYTHYYAVEGLQCIWLNESSCKLSWSIESNRRYNIQKRCVNNNQPMENIATNYGKSEIIISNLTEMAKYVFYVAAINNLEENVPAITLLSYWHHPSWFFPDLSGKNAEIPKLPKESVFLYENDKTSLRFNGELKSNDISALWIGSWKDRIEVTIRILAPTTVPTIEFVAESKLLHSLRSRHLLEVYAVFANPEQIIVSEYMCHGSLWDYIKNSEDLTLSTCIDMASHVAAGMAYLEAKGYFHSDLRATHVFVGDNNICKLDLYHVLLRTNANYLVKRSMRWIAPEAALHNKLTIKSNVWSFGILLTEILTKGFPYPELTNEDCITAVERGYRMPKIDNCPEWLYETMLKCWNKDAEARPTFEYLQYFFEDYVCCTEPIFSSYEFNENNDIVHRKNGK